MAEILAKYVISLAGSRRRDLFFDQEHAQDFEIWDAYDSRGGGGGELFDFHGHQDRYGYAPQPGEVGCAISHSSLLAHFGGLPGRDDDLMLVAEDDAVFAGDFAEVVQNVARVGGFGWALLAQPTEDPRENTFWAINRDMAPVSALARWVGPKSAPWSYRVGPYGGILVGAGLYLVTRSAARVLADYSEREGLSWVADDYVSWHQAAGIEVHLLRPTIAGWLGGSEINPATRPHLDMEAYEGHMLGRQAWKRRFGRAKGAIQVAWSARKRRGAGATGASQAKKQ